jgi:hypothetical protein
VLIANLDPALTRDPAPPSPLPLLQHFADGLTTQEVAALLAEGNDPPDRHDAEAALIELAATGQAVRAPLGDDALWHSRRLGMDRGRFTVPEDFDAPLLD